MPRRPLASTRMGLERRRAAHAKDPASVASRWVKGKPIGPYSAGSLAFAMGLFGCVVQLA